VIHRPLEVLPVAIDLGGHVRVAAKPLERGPVVGDSCLRADMYGAEHVGLLEELRLDVIDRPHPVDERYVAGCAETDVDDVALGRGDGHMVDPLLALVAAEIRSDDFHADIRNRAAVRHARALK
jgi:hypothetical protein